MGTSSYYRELALKELERNSWSYVKATLLYFGIAFIPSVIIAILAVYLGTGAIIASWLSTAYGLCITYPLSYAFANTYLDCLRKADVAPAKRMMSIFREEWGDGISTKFLLGVILYAIICCTSIAIVVPLVLIGKSAMFFAIIIGLAVMVTPAMIYGLAVSQTVYLVHDNHEKGFGSCLRESLKLMKGHKFQLFRLWLSFIGWFLILFIVYVPGFYFAFHKIYFLGGIFFLFEIAILIYLIPYFNLALAAFYRDLIGEQPEASEGNTEIEENTL